MSQMTIHQSCRVYRNRFMLQWQAHLILKIQLSEQNEPAPDVPTAKSCYCSGFRSFCRNTFDLISAYMRKGNLLVTQKQKQAFTCLRHTFFISKAQSFLPDALAQEHGIYNTSSLWQLLNQAKRDAQLICRLVLTNQGWKASPGTNSQFHYTSLAMQWTACWTACYWL